ncbi:MAG: FAD-dependent oxidoreductase [Bdellovibrionaceae bacterium]|nr:FAD-dependent oxidoreductase [Pseudobdellovibrionaceae bacterium]
MIRIIGAGFSGLSLAYHFVKRGYAVTLIEKSNRVGGVIQSSRQNQMLVESAANGFLASEKIEELFADIGVKPLETRTESRKKYIFRGRLRRWPLSFSETIILIGRLAWAVVTGRRKPQAYETLHAWAQRVLGNAGDVYLIQPMVNGIFAEKTNLLNAQLVLGALFYKKKKKSKRGLLSAAGGMDEVMQKIKDYLVSHNVRIEFEKDPFLDESILQHNTFLATNFQTAYSVLCHSSLLNTVSKTDGLRSLSLVRVTLNFKKVTDEIDGFGVLFPNVENFNAIGVLANTKIFEHRGEYNESWIFSNSTQPHLLSWSDEQIKDKISLDRQRLFKSVFEIKDMTVHRWPDVIPSYNHDLKQFLDEHSSLTQNITGNFLGVLGLTGIHERNAALVEKYMRTEKASGLQSAHPEKNREKI